MVKCTLVQALRLCTGHTAHRGSRGIALLFHDHSTRKGWGVSVTPRPLFTPGKDSVPIVQEAVCATGPVWTGAENLASTGFWSPDRPARSQSLYRLSYWPTSNLFGKHIQNSPTVQCCITWRHSCRWVTTDNVHQVQQTALISTYTHTQNLQSESSWDTVMKWSACIWEHGIQIENVCKNENQVCENTQN
jgi:hypothetical protein